MATIGNLIRPAALLLCCLPASSFGAKFQTANFLVTARDSQTARQVGQYAEHFRRQKAVEWLGYEMPTWSDPCTIEVRVTFGGAGGATSFAFDSGQVLGQSMVVEGPLERILNSVLPHEITHTVFAFKFRRPLPRWADEGGAVLSEDQQEISRHDLMVRELIRGGRMIPLARLFVLTEYPRDVMALYAQGFSVANFLVTQRGRGAFLDFVAEGQSGGWDKAVRQFYGFRSINELEKQWIDWLIAGRGTGADGPPLLAAAVPRSDRQRVVRGQRPDEFAPPAPRPELPAAASGFMSQPYAAGRTNDGERALAVQGEFSPPRSGADQSGWFPAEPRANPSGTGRNVIPAATAIEPFGRPLANAEAAAYRGFDDGSVQPPNSPPRVAAVGVRDRFDPPVQSERRDSGLREAPGARHASSGQELDEELANERVPRRIIPIAVGRTRRGG